MPLTELKTELLVWISSILDHLGVIGTGGFLVLLIQIMEKKWPHVFNWKTSRRVFLAFTLFAIFQSWQSEYKSHQGRNFDLIEAHHQIDIILGRDEKLQHANDFLQGRNQQLGDLLEQVRPKPQAPHYWIKMEPYFDTITNDDREKKKFVLKVFALTDGRINEAKGTFSCDQPFTTPGTISYMTSGQFAPVVAYGMFINGPPSPYNSAKFTLAGMWSAGSPATFLIVPADAERFRGESCALSISEEE